MCCYAGGNGVTLAEWLLMLPEVLQYAMGSSSTIDVLPVMNIWQRGKNWGMSASVAMPHPKPFCFHDMSTKQDDCASPAANVDNSSGRKEGKTVFPTSSSLPTVKEQGNGHGGPAASGCLGYLPPPPLLNVNVC